MQCPKCGHRQERTDECDACGIVFAKYEQYLKRQQEIQQALDDGDFEVTGGKRWLVPGIAATIVLAVTAAWLLKGADPETPTTTPLTPGDESVATAPSTQAPPPSPRNSDDGLEQQLNLAHPPGNTIERARNATVFIETSISRGSGFFVSSDCHIVTNKHVIDRDEEWLNKQDKQMAQASRILDFARERMKMARQQFLKTCSQCDDATFRKHFGDASDNLEKAMTIYNRHQDRLFRIRNQTRFNITLTDGSQHTAHLLRVSDRYDLAMLSLDNNHCPLLQPGSHESVHIGETLYTIGNPVGLKNTVTSGVFSGTLEKDDELYLQTDAPINPGNSGGPLITQDGHVIGVNTMILSNTEGIGFAIPMDTVRQEFNL
jgi:S1-C subfamily serine protease